MKHRGPLIAPLCKFVFSFLANHPFLVKQVLSDGWVPGQADFTFLPYWVGGEHAQALKGSGQRTGKFFFRGMGLPTVMRKNQPLVPRSNFGGKACARTAPWFRGQTLLVLGHGGGGYFSPVGI